MTTTQHTPAARGRARQNWPPGPPARLLGEFISYTPDVADVINVHEAADIMGVHEEQVRRLLRAGSLVGINHGAAGWMISKSSAERYMATRQAIGAFRRRRRPRTPA